MDSGDLPFDMRMPPIDDTTADHLLSGAMAPDDAPPGYGPVAALVRAAGGPIRGDELELERRGADVAAVVAAIRVSAAPPTPQGEKATMRKRFGLKVAAFAIPAALMASGAAAATGSLPAPAQSAVHGALAHVGVSVPGGHGPSGASANTGASGNHTSTGQPVGPDATGPAAFGLCQAFAASAGHPSANSVAFKNLQKAATAKGFATVSAYCATVTPGNSSSTSGDASGSAPDSTPGSGHVPTSIPAGPPSSTPGSSHVPSSIPAGPPSSTPGSSHAPNSTPAGPPTSTPASGTTPVSTPAGPPTSVPAGRP
jgi:hypothetical protein